MTYKACVDYARYYREMASVATTAEAWRLYKQLADLWERAGSDLGRPDKVESKTSSDAPTRCASARTHEHQTL